MAGRFRVLTVKPRRYQRLRAAGTSNVRGVGLELSDVQVVEEGSHSWVRWSAAGDGASLVEISVGSSGDVADHTPVGAVPARCGAFRLPQGARARRFVALTAGGGRTVTASRRVVLGGVLNFRDLGGYPVPGGVTRWGAIYRSDSLHRLTAAELATFDALGIRAVFDLRSAEERAMLPSRPDAIHHPLESRPVAAAVATVRTREEAEAWLAEEYRYMLDMAAASFGRLLSVLADPSQRPAVVHCAGGKDRTGMSVALVLEALGAERRLVLDDYELTSRYAPIDRLAPVVELFGDMGFTAPATDGLLSTPRWAMADALSHLDDRYGGAEAYLLGPAGMSRGTLETLQRGLVTPPAPDRRG
jgi:protein-tyrosine phosphatase